MKIQRSRVTAFIGLLVLLAGIIPSSALGQEKTIEKKKSQDGISIEKSATLGGGINPDVLHPETDVTVKFLEARFAFDKLVKAAPYSATAVTETTQTLSDGNQIIRKSEVRLYRDSEGRTRREQTLEGVKNWPAAGDPPRMIFINDPIGGYNYVLDPSRRTVRKTGGAIKPVPAITNEKGSALEKLDMTLKKMATKQEPGVDERPRKIGREDDSKKPEPRRLIKSSNTLTGISCDNSIREVVENLDEVLKGILRPDYDAAAKAAGARGSVRVRFVIGETGAVESLNIEEGSSPFKEPTLAAIKQLRFRPLMRDGKPTRNQGTITFRFTLPSAEEATPRGATIVQPAKRAPAAIAAEKSTLPKKTESLGKQVIEGVEAVGARSTLTIPAGEIGNRLPIEIVDERWYSPELQVLVMSKHHDPRSGETIYRLTNINRAEPDRSLFEVPLDFTLTESPKSVREPIKRPEEEH